MPVAPRACISTSALQAQNACSRSPADRVWRLDRFDATVVGGHEVDILRGRGTIRRANGYRSLRLLLKPAVVRVTVRDANCLKEGVDGFVTPLR